MKKPTELSREEWEKNQRAAFDFKIKRAEREVSDAQKTLEIYRATTQNTRFLEEALRFAQDSERYARADFEKWESDILKAFCEFKFEKAQAELKATPRRKTRA
jgi:hypothetical protein